MFYLTGFEGDVADGVLCFTPDGQTLISADEDNLIHLWDIPSRAERKKLKGHTSFVSGLCLIPDTTIVASGSWDNTIRLWDYTTGKKVKQFKIGASVIALDASPDGKTMAAVGGDWFPFSVGGNPVWRWNVEDWAPLDEIGSHDTQIGVVRYSPDGRFIVTGAADRLACVWDVETGDLRASFKHTAWVQGIAIHGDTLAVAAGRRVTLWRLPGADQPGEQIRILDGYKGTTLAVRFSADGRFLATGGKDGEVRIWDQELERFGLNYRWKIGEVHSVCFAPDGMTMAAGGQGKIVVWDVD